MKDQLHKRVEQLKGDFATGQKALADLEARQVMLKETLLRISGAIQVLQEELAKEPAVGNGREETRGVPGAASA